MLGPRSNVLLTNYKDWTRKVAKISIYYQGTTKVSYSASQKVPSSLVLQDSTLVVNGAVFDRVKHISQPLEHIEGASTIARHCQFLFGGLRLAQKMSQHPNDQSVEDIFLRTVVFDHRDLKRQEKLFHVRKIYRKFV